MIILIDNYDSFVYNLFQLFGQLRPDIEVVRNNACTVEELAARKPEAVIISPGPGRPEDAGICIEAIRYFAGKVPVFGVCLGHQAICRAFGGTVTYAKELMHGKTSLIKTEPDSLLFKDMKSPLKAARYHSLAASEHDLPPVLRITARTEDGEIMAFEHKEYPVYGVQFHPESIMTPEGRTIAENFINSLKQQEV